MICNCVEWTNDLHPRFLLPLFRYEFKINHEEWVRTYNPHFGPGISERISEAMRATDEKTDMSHSIKIELREALAALFEVLSVTLSHAQFTTISK